MWNSFQSLPTKADGVGSKKEIVVYWPSYFPAGSRLSVHTYDSVPDLLALDSPPIFWTAVDQIAEDTAPPSVDDKAAALAKLIEQVKAGGGDPAVLIAIADDAKIVLPDPPAKAQEADSAQAQTREGDELAQAQTP